MQIGYTGTPARGYSVDDLLKRIDNVFRKKTDQKVVLAGAGNLGRAIVSYFRDRGPRLDIVAAFDNNPEKVGASISGCPCYHVDQLPRVVRQRKVTLGIVTVPAGAAQAIADRMLLSGIRGILNFAPVRLRVPSDAYCDDMDIIGKLEKIAFFTD
jgi:redox-sensing transcriptional repressor